MQNASFLNTLIALCDDLAWGRPASEDALFSLTREGAGPDEYVRLAEAFGMMLVKVESREFQRDQLIADLKARNEELKAAQELLAERNTQLTRTLQENYQTRRIIGQCEAMRKVIQLALTIARRPINTLILGPTGSGKEVIAKSIHFNSPRRSGPFIAVNCTAIPDSLFESEMFGIEKGVATGVSSRRGLVEEASGGTLFLDELADMTLANQAKLLRVLEEREVMRVGSSRPVSVDIKVIAATNADLEAAVREGKFREDLYYRINVAEIRLPALRERGDDILLLGQLFLERHCAYMGRPRLTLAPAACRLLLEYDWPGNVRELNNEMERAAALTFGEQVEPADLSPRIVGGVARRTAHSGSPAEAAESSRTELFRTESFRTEPSGTEANAPGVTGAADTADATRAAEPAALNLQETERRLIAEALERTGGNKSRAAELLGITREGLRKKLLRLNVAD